MGLKIDNDNLLTIENGGVKGKLIGMLLKFFSIEVCLPLSKIPLILLRERQSIQAAVYSHSDSELSDSSKKLSKFLKAIDSVSSQPPQLF